MHFSKQELSSLESAALHSESLEQAAEKCFDAAHEAAERTGSVASLKTTPEFARWMAARAETDEAWGRWAECMHASGLAGAAGDA